MNQFTPRDNPPSYESVIQETSQNKSQYPSAGESILNESYFILISDDHPKNNNHKVDTIGEMTSSVPSTMPMPMPSAPPIDPNPQRTYGSITEVITIQPSNPNIVLVDACPICRIGMRTHIFFICIRLMIVFLYVGLLEPDFSCLGICLAIFCFPIGILCCLACKNKQCSNCGAII